MAQSGDRQREPGEVEVLRGHAHAARRFASPDGTTPTRARRWRAPARCWAAVARRTRGGRRAFIAAPTRRSPRRRRPRRATPHPCAERDVELLEEVGERRLAGGHRRLAQRREPVRDRVSTAAEQPISARAGGLAAAARPARRARRAGAGAERAREVEQHDAGVHDRAGEQGERGGRHPEALVLAELGDHRPDDDHEPERHGRDVGAGHAAPRGGAEEPPLRRPVAAEPLSPRQTLRATAT